MVMIWNKQKEEWDNKGTDPQFHPFRRWAWEKLAQAKNHIASVLSNNYSTQHFYEIIEWYMDSEFVSVSDYRYGDWEYSSCAGFVRRWLIQHERMIRARSTSDNVQKIEKMGVWQAVI